MIKVKDDSQIEEVCEAAMQNAVLEFMDKCEKGEDEIVTLAEIMSSVYMMGTIRILLHMFKEEKKHIIKRTFVRVCRSVIKAGASIKDSETEAEAPAGIFDLITSKSQVVVQPPSSEN